MDDDDEWGLIADALTGDGEAFGEFYDLHLTHVYRFILTMTRHRTVAEELTSQTFFTALRDLATLRRGADRPRAWLFRIARTVVHDHVRNPASRRTPAVDVFNVSDPDPDAGPDEIVDDEDERTRRTIMIRGLTARLPPEQRRCIVLRLGLGLGVEDVCRLMGRSPKAVALLTYRAMRSLRLDAGLPVEPLP